MNIQRKNSAHHFRVQSEREQTLVTLLQWKTIDVVIKHKLYDNSRLMILKFLIGILPKQLFV